MSSDWLLNGSSGEDYSNDEYDASGQTIDSISRSLQRFDWPDYVVFVLMLLICIVIGVFFGYQDHQKHKRRRKQARRDSEALDYLVGGRKMQIFPVSVSLVASWISGISLLGTSTEIYVYGTQYCYIVIAVVLMGFVMHHIFLPVFHELQITSAYEGGLKAVVWTDVIQSGVTLLALLAVLIKGTYDVGGPAEVLQRNIAGDRLEVPSIDPDPTLRHSIWIILIGAPAWFCYGVSCSQDMIQRFLALPTLQDARKALKGFVIGWITVNVIFFLIGMLVYATYYRCDPLTTQLAKAKDQLLPLFVMETFAEYPGMTGVFVAGIFSAALSSLSSALNALSAITLEDFCKPYRKKPLTEKQIGYVMRGSVLVYGALSVLLSLLVEHLGTVMQLTMTLSSASGAPLFGLFVMGVLMPWVNGTGALYGGVTGLLVMLYMCYSAQYSIASGSRTFDTKPVSVEECPYEYTRSNITSGLLDADSELEHVEKSIYHISYMYFTLFGTSVTCLSGTIGGLKAVIWTDVIQSGVTLLALLAVLIKGTYDVGGPAEVLQRNIAGERLEAPIFDPNPILRHSFWIMLLGAPVWICEGLACSQDMIQRFLSLPTLKEAQKALNWFVIGWITVNVIFFLIGMLVYATYYRCDPLTTELAKAKDQLLPLFVLETFAEYPGMTGVFVAGIFSAALSSLSSALNALSAITLEDFCKPYCKKPLTEKQIGYIMRGSVLIYGTISILLSFCVEHLGTVMQLAMTLSSASAAPLLGMFVMGCLMPWVNGTGALYGGVIGLVTMFYMCYNAEFSIATGIRTFDMKPVSVQECPYELASYTNASNFSVEKELNELVL
uniref:Sodium/solute symporter n=1 Tax=Anopheles culicifacies TaxID=139723 RepID=A0A182LRU4_9DIPT